MNALGLLIALIVFACGAGLAWAHYHRNWWGWVTIWPSRPDLHWRDAETAKEWSEEFPGLIGPFRVVACTRQRAKDEMLQSFYDGVEIEYRTDFTVQVQAKEVSG